MFSRPDSLIRVLMAPASVGLALAARLAIDPAFGDRSPYFLLLAIPVLLSALVGGFWTGALATSLTVLAIDFFFAGDRALFDPTRGEWLQLGVFVLEGLAISAAGAVILEYGRERTHILENERAARKEADEERRRFQELAQGLGVALYATDAQGKIEFFNDAAVDLWGRAPEPGADNWCGSWRLYHPDGRPMAHEDCPMAITLKTGVEVRGAEAIAERPDGTRVTFLPFPTLMRDAHGQVSGAVNVLVDVTERRRAEEALRSAEAKFRGIFENAVFGIFQTTPTGEYVSANDALAHIFGYDSAEELWVSRISGQDNIDQERREEFARRLREEGTVNGFTAHARRKNGEEIWVALSGRVIRDEQGEIEGYEGIVEDITTRIKAEEKVADLLSSEQDARLEAEEGQRRLAFLASASGSLFRSLQQGGLTLAHLPNLAVPDLADICVAYKFARNGSPAEVAFAGRDAGLEEMARQFHDDMPGGEPALLAKLLRSGAPILFSDIYEGALLELAQTERQRELLRKASLRSYMAVPLVVKNEMIGAMAFASVDPAKRFGDPELSMAVIIAQRASVALHNAVLYQESLRTHEELRAAAAAKDEFLALMSHELRTPITAIMGGARILRSRNGTLDDETRKELLTDIDSESERLYRMVENLLALGRMELGQTVVTEPVLAQRIVQAQANSYMQRKPGRTIEVETDEYLQPAAASQPYLELAIHNLLSNADKYSPPDQPITITAREKGDEVEIAVLDRGTGIDPSEAESIFERFYRSDRISGNFAGAGLGLTVCKRMIEAQAGHVWARNREGGGAEVGLTLPVYKNGSHANGK